VVEGESGIPCSSTNGWAIDLAMRAHIHEEIVVGIGFIYDAVLIVD